MKKTITIEIDEAVEREDNILQDLKDIVAIIDKRKSDSTLKPYKIARLIIAYYHLEIEHL